MTKQSIKQPATYIVTNKMHGTLYTGVTSNLIQRTAQHKSKTADSFTAKHDCIKLVYYELHETVEQAILREKQLKAGSRQKKLDLIKSLNPDWTDLFDHISK